MTNSPPPPPPPPPPPRQETDPSTKARAWARENDAAVVQRRAWIAQHGVPLAAWQVLELD
ncbi:hypothetical protein SAMN05444415_105289 [Salipiger profundus]|nr:hypothetical protein SAMN05444415_105289 [Salipiger profundus]